MLVFVHLQDHFAPGFWEYKVQVGVLCLRPQVATCKWEARLVVKGQTLAPKELMYVQLFQGC